MKKIIKLLFFISITNAMAMEKLLNPEDSKQKTNKNFCQRCCQYFGLDRLFTFRSNNAQNLQNPPTTNTLSSLNGSESPSLVEMMNNLSLNDFSRPLVTIAKTQLWYHILRYLSPSDLISLGCTNSQILRWIKTSPAFDHRLYLHQRTSSFHDTDHKFTELALNRNQTEAFFKSYFSPQYPQYSLAKSCANLSPIIIVYEDFLKNHENNLQLASTTNVFWVGYDQLLKQPPLHSKTLSLDIMDTDASSLLDSSKLKDISFCLRVKNFDEKKLQFLQSVPRLSGFSVVNFQKNDEADSANFFSIHLPEMHKSWNHLQEFVYTNLSFASGFHLNLDKSVLKNILYQLGQNAPLLKKVRFTSHVLEEAMSISQEIKSIHNLETLDFSGAKSEAFAILDFLGPHIENIKMPLKNPTQETLVFAQKKIISFLASRTKIKKCDFEVFPTDQDPFFYPLLQGYESQESLESFSYCVKSASNLSLLSSALATWKNLKHLSVKYLNKPKPESDFQPSHRSVLQNECESLSTAICHNASLMNNPESTAFILSNSPNFFAYMAQNLPEVHRVYGLASCDKETRKYLASIFKKKKPKSALQIQFYLNFDAASQQEQYLDDSDSSD
jgi:hypothetical protein